MKKSDGLLIVVLTVALPAWLMAGPRGDDAVPAAPASAAAAAPVSPAAGTAPAKATSEATIQFANNGGIWDWEVVDSNTLLIQDRSRRWYKAKLLGNCHDLPFEQKIGFESNPNGSFNRFSAIQTRQQRCPLISLTRTKAPAKKLRKGDSNAKPGPILVPPHATENAKPLT